MMEREGERESYWGIPILWKPPCVNVKHPPWFPGIFFELFYLCGILGNWAKSSGLFHCWIVARLGFWYVLSFDPCPPKLMRKDRESQHLFLRFPIFSPFFLVRSGRRLVWHACRLDLCQSRCHPVPNSWSVCQQHRLGKARGPPATAAGTAGSGREPIFALPSPMGPLPWQVAADLQNLKGNKGNDRTQAPKGGTAIERISLVWSGVLINCFKELAIFQDLLRWREKVKERERPLRLIVLLLQYLMCWSVTVAGVLTNSRPVPF